MLGIGSRALAALRSGKQELSALELMRALPRHQEAAKLTNSAAQKAFSAFEKKYRGESPDTRADIFSELAYAAASGAFKGPMEALAQMFQQKFEQDAKRSTPDQASHPVGTVTHVQQALDSHVSRSGLKQCRDAVARMTPGERLLTWHAAAEAAGNENDSKRLGTALLRAESKQVLQDCKNALFGAAVQTTASSAPTLYVLGKLCAISSDSKEKAEANSILSQFAHAAGAARQRAASDAPTPAQAQNALQLPSVRKQKISSKHNSLPADPKANNFSRLEIAGNLKFSGLVSKTFASGNFSKVRVLRSDEGIYYVLRMTRSSDKVRGNQPSASGRKPTERTPLNAYWNEERILDLVQSPLRSLAKGIDEKGRIFNVVAMYDGNMEALMTQLHGPARAAMFGLAAERVLESIAKLESENLVHGDIKPDNMLFRYQGDVVLADYGKAHLAEVKGSPGAMRYLPPEFYSPDFVNTPKYDLYSLGLSLVHMAIGDRFDVFPLQASAGFRKTKTIYETWEGVEAGSIPAPQSGSMYNSLREIREAYEAMKALDPQVADVTFKQLLQTDPSRRGDAATALATLRAGGLDRSNAVKQHLPRLAEIEASDPMAQELNELKHALEAVAINNPPEPIKRP